MTQSLVDSIVSPLGAIEAFAATDKVVAEVGNSVWEQFARYVQHEVDTLAASMDDLAGMLGAGEQVYKGSNKGGCPASYRSAKSTALGAVRRGISLLDPDGNPVGKSAIAEMCKDFDRKLAGTGSQGNSDPDPALMSAEQRAYTLARFQRAAARLSKLALSQEEASKVRTTCEALIAGTVVE